MDKDIIIVATVVSLTLLIFIVVFLFLLVSRSNRRHKHQAEIANLKVKTVEEMGLAEREAIHSTLSDIGRELHDNIGQLLAAAHLSFNYRFEEVMDSDEQLASISTILDQAINEVRRLSRNLNKDIWKDQSLIQGINESAAHIERLGLGIVHIKQQGLEPNLKPEEKVILFRAFQEIVNNAFNHGKAKKIEVLISSTPFAMEISDDGQGFDKRSSKPGNGLINIRRRAQMIDIHAEMYTAIGQGCTWKFRRI